MLPSDNEPVVPPRADTITIGMKRYFRTLAVMAKAMPNAPYDACCANLAYPLERTIEII